MESYSFFFCDWPLPFHGIFKVNPRCSMDQNFLPPDDWVILPVDNAACCLSTHSWTFGFPLFCLLWIVLLWNFRYVVLRGHVFSFLLGVHPGVELLSHVITFSGAARLFQSDCTAVHSPQSVRSFHFFHTLTNTCCCPSVSLQSL